MTGLARDGAFRRRPIFEAVRQSATRGLAQRAILFTSAVAVAALAVAAGCSSKGPPPAAGGRKPLTAKLTVACPGISRKIVDDQISYLFFNQALMIPHVQAFTCISRDGAFEAYVQADPNDNPKELTAQLEATFQSDKMPHGLGTPSVIYLTTDMPKITPTAVPTMNIIVDPEKLARFGLTTQAVTAAVSKATATMPAGLARPSKGDLSDMNEMILTTPAGAKVPLADVATVTIRSEPDCIVRTYPEK